VAIYEVLPIDEDIRRFITKDADLDKLRQIQREKNYEGLLQNGLRKVEQGLTTLEEVLSVAYE
jgi:type IV pilus assembly protein PilB